MSDIVGPVVLLIGLFIGLFFGLVLKQGEAERAECMAEARFLKGIVKGEWERRR